MRRASLILALAFILGFSSMAQRNCGTVEYTRMLEEEIPGFSAARLEIEEFTAQYMHDRHLRGGTRDIITIPVVVHVLYHPSIVYQNIPFSRVLEQIAVLNEDFRALNADTASIPALFTGDLADTRIQFCLATRDPDSNWTDGVTRTETSQASFDISDNNIIKSTALGGHDPWDRNRYLNIWVCNLSGNILGYAQPPGGPASTDGVVISYKYFGISNTTYPYNKGRTSTHEVGHYFNLLHIWGDDNGACWGSDHCDDTPNQASDNYGCPTYPHPSCNNTSDMFMNYMDYVNDACMVMFTHDQRDRMLATLNGFRGLLQSSDGCDPPVGMPELIDPRSVEVFPVPAGAMVTLRYSLSAPSESGISLFNAMGVLIETRNVESGMSTEQVFNLGTLPAGIYLIRLDAPGGSVSKVFSHLAF